MNTLGLVAIAVLAGGGIGCDDTTPAVDTDPIEANGKADIGSYGAKVDVDRETGKFRLESKAALEAMNRKLQRLERSVEHGSAEAKIEAQDELLDLRRKRDELARTVERADAKSKAQLAETERKIDHRLAELGKDINRALSRAGDETEEALE